MKIVTWLEVLEAACGICGLDEERLSEIERKDFKGWINKALKHAWEVYNWPDLMRTQERFYRPVWLVGTVYAIGDEVYDPATDAYYERLTAGSGEPVTNTTAWAPLAELDAYVRKDQPGLDEIGEVFRVTQRNPKTSSEPGKLYFERSENGIQLTGSVPTSVWITFRLPVPVWLGPDYDPATAVADGDTVYSDTLGDFVAIIDAGGTGLGLDLTDTAVATVIEVPLIFKDYAGRQAAAQWLKGDGQWSKARTEQNDSGEELDREIEKIVGQEKQSGRYRVRNRGTRR